MELVFGMFFLVLTVLVHLQLRDRPHSEVPQIQTMLGSILLVMGLFIGVALILGAFDSSNDHGVPFPVWYPL